MLGDSIELSATSGEGPNATRVGPCWYELSCPEGDDVVLQDKNTEAYRAIDQQLRTDSFYAVALTPAHKYEAWYAELLSSFALLVGGETVEYAYANFAIEMRDVRIVVFTTHLVLVADVDREEDGVPVVQAASRRSLTSMRLSASAPVDAKERRPYEWPGTLTIQLTYPGLSKVVEIVADGADRFQYEKPTPIVALVEGLGADLGANT